MASEAKRFNKNRIVWVLLVLSTAGCASNPDQINPVSVSPQKYKDFDCNQLKVEIDYIEQQVNNLYRRLKSVEESDQVVMGVALFWWPSLFALEGDGPATLEFARLKGEFEALRSSAARKNCSIDALSPS